MAFLRSSSRLLKRSLVAGSAVAAGTFLVSTTDILTPVHAATAKDLPPLTVPAPHAPPPTRESMIKRLQSEEFDIVIIGGGATGAGAALDAATRGLKVALVERDDFACGTSSRSTKLVHGGVRYLEKAFWNLDYGQYKLVKEALAERSNFIKIAPHLSFALPIMIPVYTWWQIPYFYVGTKMYDLVAGSQNLAPSYFMFRKTTLETFPQLKHDNLKGALVYYDGSHNDSRMNTALALTAIEKGAVVVNHMEVTELTKDSNGRVNGIVAKDTDLGHSETVTVKAKGVVNATGPFSDAIRKLDAPMTSDIVAPSSGVHVVLPNFYCPKNMGLIDPQTSDGRVIFLLPWQGNVLAGTTDAPTTVSKDPIPTEEEIGWILNELKNYMSADLPVRREDVLAAWCGIRPLVRDPRAKNTESLVRNHLITVSDSGLLTVAGGKWTTYREMAEDTINECIQVFDLKPTSPCQTKHVPLVGAAGYRPLLYMQLAQHYGLETEIAQHLASNYGDRAFDVLALCSETGHRWPAKGVRLANYYPFVDGEVRYAVRNELARTVEDVVSRRMRLAFLNSKAALESLPVVIDIMAEELKWSEERKQEEWDSSVKYLFSMGLPSDKVWTRAEIEAGDLKVLG
ncbi:mitochondrial glycerol-3-phosphate dehydrogenase [Myxozyma melibiosi]|uniref:Glycerol-3-phosphate dehydrogenase n=1 Tax=Myxozyma melibiosi TaxID=54550 RepID=A0ABR1F6H8_9ASCO